MGGYFEWGQKMMVVSLSRKDSFRQVLSLSIPVIMENFLQTLLGTADTYFAGQVHDNAIAAINVTNLVINLFLAVYTAISIGTAAVVSRNVGREDSGKGPPLPFGNPFYLGLGLEF